MTRKIVYAVSGGDYSDYRVEALFTTEALAEAHKEAGAGDRVEEFVLFDRAPVHVTIYSINGRVWPDGSVTREHHQGGPPEMDSRVEWEYGSYWGRPRAIMEARILQAPYSGKDWLVRVSGTDKAKVQKAFDDWLAQARARTLGIDA